METEKPRRRSRYRGTHPRRFDQKYKEHDPARFPDVIEKVIQSGRTPAGMHLPIMVGEILDALKPGPGDVVVDATLGYGGHASELLGRISPGGRLIGLDVDSSELPRTAERLASKAPSCAILSLHHANFARMPEVLEELGIPAVDRILADLGCSSMQLDDPARGFSFKKPGPLDMRLDPAAGESASRLLTRLTEVELAAALEDLADEPHAQVLARHVLGRREKIRTTLDLAQAVRDAFDRVRPRPDRDGIDRSVRCFFQALRILVNDEMGVLERFLGAIPSRLGSGGRVAILTFHSGEDRRVKKAFKEGLKDGLYSEVARDVVRASPEETRRNPRASSAKLRWAIRT